MKTTFTVDENDLYSEVF